MGAAPPTSLGCATAFVKQAVAAMAYLLSAVFWSWLVLSSLALFPGAVAIWLVTVPFDRRLNALHRYTCFWASLYTWTNPAWSVSIRGRSRFVPGTTYVLVSNHQSLVDILAAFRLFLPFKWVAKAELFSLPVVGWNMRLNRYIPIRRGDARSAETMLNAAERTLRAGCSVYLFPEGTRSRTPELRHFKTGAFRLAQRTRTPILPIAISGSRDALPKHSLLLRGKHHIQLTLLEPISAEHVCQLSPEALAAEVRTRIAAALIEDAGFQPLGPPGNPPTRRASH